MSIRSGLACLFFILLASCTSLEKPDEGKTLVEDVINKKEWYWGLAHEEIENKEGAWYYGDEGYYLFWDTHGGVREMALRLPPYAIHQESIKDFANKLKNSRVVKNGKKETLFLKYPGKNTDKKIVLDKDRRGLMVFRQDSPFVECYLYHDRIVDDPDDLGGSGVFDQVLYVDLGKEISERSRMAYSADDITQIVGNRFQEQAKILDLSSPWSPSVKDSYHNTEYWNSHDIKFIICAYPKDSEAWGYSLYGELVKGKYKKSGNGVEELVIPGDICHFPERRFVLDRQREWLLVFDTLDVRTHPQIRCYKRINGSMRCVKSVIFEDIHTEGKPLQYSSDEVSRKGWFWTYDPHSP